jgi:hypothetical protein
MIAALVTDFFPWANIRGQRMVRRALRPAGNGEGTRGGGLGRDSFHFSERFEFLGRSGVLKMMLKSLAGKGMGSRNCVPVIGGDWKELGFLG